MRLLASASMAIKQQIASRTLSPTEIVRLEAAALEGLAERLTGSMIQPFDAAVDLILHCTESGHRVIVCGMGKSGLIGRKVAATLCSVGIPSHFLHPADALHGDLGMLSAGDVLLALSSSGTTSELLRLLPSLRRRRIGILAFCGTIDSELARSADLLLDTSVSVEACPHDLVPTASSTVMLALGDALAITLSVRRGFSPQDFADLHPDGDLGRRLTRVRDLMHRGTAVPTVRRETPVTEVIYEMSRKKLGMTTVVENNPGNQLLGMISDGDLRRLLENDGTQALHRVAADIMNPHPVTIGVNTFALEALALMEGRRITSLVVTDADANVQGIVHIHDLWRALEPGREFTREAE